MDLKILIVEDDVVFCKLLTKYLNSNSVETKDAQSSASAKEMLQKEKFDFIVLDYKLPDEDGLAVLEWIKKEAIDVKKILMSRFDDEKVIQKAKDLGVIRFIKKPLKPNELLDSLKELHV